MAPRALTKQTGSSTLVAGPRQRRPISKGKRASVKGLKRRDGLLNTSVSARSDLLHLAQRNSDESPLLRLPGELRDTIWRYALGDHQIDIQNLSQEEPVNSIYDLRTLYPDTMCPPGFVRPTFQLPKVCRQIYVEASPYIYTLNTFAFHSIATADRWMKKRCMGQRRLIASLDVPRTYARLYRSGFRKAFRSKFPNIERIGIDNWSLFCEYDELRRLPENKGKGALELWVEAKAKIIAEIQEKEGQDVCVEWHGQSA